LKIIPTNPKHQTLTVKSGAFYNNKNRKEKYYAKFANKTNVGGGP
jgi:hypothetical protein